MFFIVAIALTCIFAFCGCDNMKYDNLTDKKDIITYKYSSEKINRLKEKVETSTVSLKEFKKEFNLQCVRKVNENVYYVVLMQEDGKSVFVFINSDFELTNNVIIVDKFKTKEEFENQELKTKSDVLEFDNNTVWSMLSGSFFTTTIHIVQEGVCCVNYNYFQDGVYVEDPYIDSIQFVTDEEIATYEFVPFPYILEIDRK